MLWVLKTTDSMRRSFKKLHPKLIFWMDKKILTLKPKVKLFLYLEMLLLIRPNKKISVLRVTGLKILGTKGRHILLKKNLEKYNFKHFMHFERRIRHSKCIKIIFFQENLKKLSVSPVNLGRVWLH